MEANGSNGAGAAPRENMAQYRSKKGTRARPGPKPEEEVGEELRLGDEFAGVHAMSVSEARFIIEAAELTRKTAGKKLRDTEPLLKMMTYMDTFARFRNQQSLYALEAATGAERFNVLDSFERAQLLTLCCESTDEARLLIPSLGAPKKDENDHANKISDDVLRELLETILQQDEYAGNK